MTRRVLSQQNRSFALERPQPVVERAFQGPALLFRFGNAIGYVLELGSRIAKSVQVRCLLLGKLAAMPHLKLPSTRLLSSQPPLRHSKLIRQKLSRSRGFARLIFQLLLNEKRSQTTRYGLCQDRIGRC